MQDSNATVKEMTSEKNRIFVFSDTSDFKQVEYKILMGQKYNGMVPFYKCTLNGRVELLYLTEKYYKISEMFQSIEKDRVISILRQICKTIDDVRKNGFLSDECLILEMGSIYYDPATDRTRLLYLPAKQKKDQGKINTNEKLHSLINQMIETAKDGLLTLWFSDICKRKHGSLDLDYLIERLQEDNIRSFFEQALRKKKLRNIIPETNQDHVANQSVELILESVEEDEQIIFHINKNRFLIGRKQTVVDGLIPGTKPLVGRVHCSIDRRNGHFYVTSLVSMNGTFLNGKKINLDNEVLLNNDDILQLANVKFRVKYCMGGRIVAADNDSRYRY